MNAWIMFESASVVRCMVPFRANSDESRIPAAVGYVWI